MDKGDKILTVFLVLWFMFFLVGGIYTESQIKNEVEAVAGKDYIKLKGEHVTGSLYINEIYNKDGGCVGIYYIKNDIYKYRFEQLKNFERCEVLK